MDWKNQYTELEEKRADHADVCDHDRPVDPRFSDRIHR